MVTKNYYPTYLCDSNDSSDSCHSCDINDSSDSCDRSDSSDSSAQILFFTKKRFLQKIIFKKKYNKKNVTNSNSNCDKTQKLKL